MEKRYAIKKLKIKVTDKTHKFIEVGNSGGGSLEFWPTSFEGILGVVRKSRGPFFVLDCIFMTRFIKPYRVHLY
jgi:hypothetical protein